MTHTPEKVALCMVAVHVTDDGARLSLRNAGGDEVYVRWGTPLDMVRLGEAIRACLVDGALLLQLTASIRTIENARATERQRIVGELHDLGMSTAAQAVERMDTGGRLEGAPTSTEVSSCR